MIIFTLMSRGRYIDFKIIKKYARQLRTNLTTSEKVLWKELRGRKLNSLKFLRQHPIVYKADLSGLNYFVADFYCAEKKTVIELDGSIHQFRIDYDNFRDSCFAEMGIHVLRISNDELKDIDKVLLKIRTFLSNI